jgi:hypothetical protein
MSTPVYPSEIIIPNNISICNLDNCKPKPRPTMSQIKKKSFNKSMNSLYDSIYEKYQNTTAYDITKRNQQSLLSNENSIPNRFKRWYNEEFIIVEQNKWNTIQFIFTFILLVLTTIIIWYMWKNELIIVPQTIVDKTKMSNDDITNLNHYNNMNLSSNIIKGISIFYITIFTSVNIFKRTTY